MTLEAATASCKRLVLETGSSALVYRDVSRSSLSPARYGIAHTLPMFGEYVQRYYTASTIGIHPDFIVEGS